MNTPSSAIPSSVVPVLSANSDIVNTLSSTPAVAAPLVTATSTQSDLVVCSYCQKTFKKKGLANHVRSCKLKNEHQKRLSTSMPLNNPNYDDVLGASQVCTKVFSNVFRLLSDFCHVFSAICVMLPLELSKHYGPTRSSAKGCLRNYLHPEDYQQLYQYRM